MLTWLRNLFHMGDRDCTPEEAEEALNNAIYICGVAKGPKWVAWKLTDVLEVITKEGSEVNEAWEGLHQVYKFNRLLEAANK